VPLTGLVSFETDDATVSRITVSDGERHWNVRDFEGESTSFREHIAAGMRPDRNHIIEITVRNASGSEFRWSEAIAFATDSLPDDLPELTATASDSNRMEPGSTVFCVRKSARFGPADYG